MIQKASEDLYRYIGGGKVFFTPKGESQEYEIGEVLEFNASQDVTTAEAINKDSSMQYTVAKVVTGMKGKIEFKTQNINPKNLAMAFLGTYKDVTIAVGEKLPDGSTAAAETTITEISAGTKPLFLGAIKFVGDRDGDKAPVFEVYEAYISPNGGFNYMSNEFVTLSFSGEIAKTPDKPLWKESRMTVV